MAQGANSGKRGIGVDSSVPGHEGANLKGVKRSGKAARSNKSTLPPMPAQGKNPRRNALTGRWQDPTINPRPLMGLFPADLKQTQRRLLGAYLLGGTILEAARIAGLHWTSHYHWMDDSESYVKAFQRAKEILGDPAEDSLRVRGVNGYDKPVIYKGKITAWYKDYSDACLIAFLKGNNPTKYRESLVSFTANAPTAITIQLGAIPDKPTQPAIEGPDGADGPFEAIPTISTG